MSTNTPNNVNLRQATADDVGLLLTFIRAIADYEKLLDQVVATEDVLREWMFEKHTAQAIIAELDGEPVGFALYYFNFSTFLGRAGVYLEDLFVYPKARGFGIGKALFQKVASIAVEQGCGRMEWQCLDWNTPSIDFYLSMDALPMKDWTCYRLSGDTLLAAAGYPVTT